MTISAEEFCRLLDERGFAGCAGVPCSYFSGPTALLGDRGRYVPAANEGAALALAAGSALAGARVGVLIQNSGFGNLLNPLTSLLLPYRIGVVVFMSLRGWPNPADDEPQHAAMGATSHALLNALGVAHWTLATDSAADSLDRAVEVASSGRPAFVLVPKGVVGPATPCQADSAVVHTGISSPQPSSNPPLNRPTPISWSRAAPQERVGAVRAREGEQTAARGDAREPARNPVDHTLVNSEDSQAASADPTLPDHPAPQATLSRAEAVKAVAASTPGAAIVATTGYTSRELCAIDDRPGNFYMQGSMGHASAIGLGVAIAAPHRRVVVLDGDGAALMHLGTLSTIGSTAPPNLTHVVLDNGSYESTGAQPTTASTTDLALVARAAGYRSWTRCADADSIAAALARTDPGPHCVVVATATEPGVTPPRVTGSVGPAELTDRFTNELGAP